ncbi:hypothetical protein MJ560_13635 [Klebsiella pneumoniae]|nr:hypothetical protein MJ560_13635 [Klebsiella pneumoniae]
MMLRSGAGGGDESATEWPFVSLTITEKGYCHSPASGELQLDHLLIVADLHNPHF